MKKRKLVRTILISYILYALVLILCIGSVVLYQNVNTQKEKSKTTAFAYTKAAAEFIDGDALEKYINSGEKDSYYTEIENYLTASLNNSDIQDFYIGVPREDDILFLVDISKTEDTLLLGDTVKYDEYAEGTKEFLASVFCQNPSEEIISGYENGIYIATACSPILNSAGEPVAIVAVDLLVPNLRSEIISALMSVNIVIIVLVILSAFASFYFEWKRVIVPIQTLNNETKQIVNNLESGVQPKINIKTGNEIEELSDSFSQMYSEIHDYIKRLSVVTSEKERISAELDVAAKIQASMLPCIFPPFPNRKEFEIFAMMNPAKEVGGDFYDFFMVDNDHLAIVVADVSGKGVPAALFMVIGKTLIKDHTAFHKDLGDVFTEVNDILCASNSEEMFITAFEGVLNIHTGEFRYVNAGHEIPFICKKGNVYKPFPIKAGFVLAGMEGIHYKGGCITLEPGDKLFQYTDGVTEAADSSNKLFGMDKLEKTLVKNSNKSMHELLVEVQKDIDSFVGNTPQFDDITMLGLEYKGDKNMQEKTLDATIENIDVITDFINEQLELSGCPLKAQTQIDVAIDEIFSNIARYAYQSKVGQATVRIEMFEDPKSVAITFIDSGIPFNPLEMKDPDTSAKAEVREVGGLGVYIVKKSMDKVSYENKDGKNILRIQKNYETEAKK